MDNDLATALEQKDSLSFQQVMIGRKYAKMMIAFLKDR